MRVLFARSRGVGWSVLQDCRASLENRKGGRAVECTGLGACAACASEG